ncbi:unnamed protein product [Symbiodinium sp. CCMP2456]|nr:unnamed protein product [Symbiodinium sp. CCMP2456]
MATGGHGSQHLSQESSAYRTTSSSQPSSLQRSADVDGYVQYPAKKAQRLLHRREPRTTEKPILGEKQLERVFPSYWTKKATDTVFDFAQRLKRGPLQKDDVTYSIERHGPDTFNAKLRIQLDDLKDRVLGEGQGTTEPSAKEAAAESFRSSTEMRELAKCLRSSRADRNADRFKSHSAGQGWTPNKRRRELDESDALPSKQKPADLHHA